MKKKITQYMLISFFILASFNSFSQEASHRTPAWVSDKGYWVVEGNIHQPLQCSVRFYNNDHVLTGKTAINGTRLNVRKRKVKMRLKAMLETSLLLWASANAAGGNNELVIKHE
ncbi:MAG: hypothetical protein ABIQ88_02010 [Chitinophagaceae bacterium]